MKYTDPTFIFWTSLPHGEYKLPEQAINDFASRVKTSGGIRLHQSYIIPAGQEIFDAVKGKTTLEADIEAICEDIEYDYVLFRSDSRKWVFSIRKEDMLAFVKSSTSASLTGET